MSDDMKTNVMRRLDQKKIPYKVHHYFGNDAKNGVEVAQKMENNPNQTFKTLVTVSKSKEHYVFMIPVSDQLDLKKAAKAVGEKNVSMIAEKELEPLTGYVHGGCSPIGMKKNFKTTIDQQVQQFDTFIFSGGKIGLSVEMKPNDLKKIIRYKTADVVKDLPSSS